MAKFDALIEAASEYQKALEAVEGTRASIQILRGRMDLEKALLADQERSLATWETRVEALLGKKP